MKKILLPVLVLALLGSSCKQQNTSQQEPQKPVISNELTAEEKAGGVMTPEMMWKFGRFGAFALSPDGKSVVYSVTNIELATEKSLTNLFTVNTAGGDPVQITSDGGSSPQWINDGKAIAFVHDGKICTINPDGTGLKTITGSGLDGFEMFSVSPDGKKIYFTKRVKLDQTANEKHDLDKAKVRIIDDLMYRHWNSWSDYSYSHVFVGSFDGSAVSGEKDIMEGQRFESPNAPYYDETELAWSPDSRHIAYTCKRLTGKEYSESTNTDIYLYDTEAGTEVNISEGNKGYDRCPVFSPDGTKIAWQSMERDGYEADLDRLFVYDIASGKRDWVTKGWEFDVENINWSDNQTLWFNCSHLGTSQVFKTSLADGKVVKVTGGVHNLGPINIRSGVMASGITSMSMAPELATVDMNTGEVKQITFINKSIYDVIKMGKVEEKYVKTKDKKDLQMWVVYPPDFDPAKKYPALLFCLGGPESKLDQFWSYRWNFQMMAAKGYIVYAPNRRGVKGFGQPWTEEIAGDYGGANMQDYLDATDAMAKEQYVDKDHMGAVGASYGGYSVFYLAGIHNNRFKAFVSHCGMFDFTSWYGSTEELWFPNFDIEGAYWKSPKSYDYSPHLKVDKWNTPILIITGANDFRIPYTQSLEAFQAAQLHNVPSRLLFFENEYHWVTKPQNSVIWQREYFEWLDKYLK